MPSVVKTRGLAIAGLIVLAVLALTTVKGDISLGTAGARAGILLVVLSVLDRVAVPIGKLLIGEPAGPRQSPGAQPDGGETTVTAEAQPNA